MNLWFSLIHKDCTLTLYVERQIYDLPLNDLFVDIQGLLFMFHSQRSYIYVNDIIFVKTSIYKPM